MLLSLSSNTKTNIHTNMLRNHIIKIIKKDRVLIAELQIVLDKSEKSIKRYLDANNPALCSVMALNVFYRQYKRLGFTQPIVQNDLVIIEENANA